MVLQPYTGEVQEPILTFKRRRSSSESEVISCLMPKGQRVKQLRQEASEVLVADQTSEAHVTCILELTRLCDDSLAIVSASPSKKHRSLEDPPPPVPSPPRPRYTFNNIVSPSSPLRGRQRRSSVLSAGLLMNLASSRLSFTSPTQPLPLSLCTLRDKVVETPSLPLPQSPVPCKLDSPSPPVNHSPVTNEDISMEMASMF